MRSYLVLLSALVIICDGTLSAQQPQDQPTPAFRAGVDVVSLNVTVSDLDGRFITNLDQTNFQVYEDGVQQNVTFFTRTQLPIALAMLIDTSASMDEKMATAQEAAIGFSQRLRPEDLVEIVDFDSRVNILQTFTNDAVELEQAIQQTSAGGSTSLYNAIYISLRELSKAPLRRADVRREAIIVLSDGEDTSSLVTFDEVLEQAKRSETAIYSIGLQSDDSRSRVGFREADFVLRQLAQETGGRAFFPNEVDELPKIYQEISDELSSQYSVGYISGNPLRNGQWRRIVVRVDRESVEARAKQGYYSPKN
ncbi:MAG TPA: VWA domain-containing protein [Acidobacteria bacterium]|nr:VWA domain-containing protein [Acidobacteriota bacterium]